MVWEIVLFQTHNEDTEHRSGATATHKENSRPLKDARKRATNTSRSKGETKWIGTNYPNKWSPRR